MSAHREYQQRAVEAVEREWMDGVQSTLLVLPTGAGKTVVASQIIKRRLPQRSIFIAHREELVFQARERILMVAGVDSDIEKAELTATTSLWGRSPCVVASVQTLISGKEVKRMERFKPEDFATLIIDECHRSPCDSYREIIAYFSRNPHLKILGLTATPDRLDEQALGQIFQTVAFDYEILDAIHDGWLVPIEQLMVSTDVDFSGIRTQAGDLNGADLAAVMEAEEAIQGVAGATMNIVGNKRTLVFAASVKQAEMLCNIFNRHKAGSSEWVCGATPRDDRRGILERFESGETQIVCNCAVLTEGFDCPPVECIVMARPTKSRALYAQCCGRSLRPLDGLVDNLGSSEERKAAIASSPKKTALIVDFVGNSGKHKLMTTADILGGKVSDEAVERAIDKAKKEGKAVNMQQLLDEEEEKLRQEMERRRLAEEARKARVLAKVSYRTTAINPFDVFDLSPNKTRGWDNNRMLSEKQCALLRRQGVNPNDLSYSEGRQVVNEIFRRFQNNLCTTKQANVVRKYFPEVKIKDLTMKEATQLINQLAANGWKRPAAAA